MFALRRRLPRHNWVRLLLCSSILHFATSQDSEQVSPSVTSSPVTPDIATETVDFTSALRVAASVAPALAFGNFSNPIPLPTDAPNYEDVSRIAARFPPLQQFIGEPDLSVFAEIHAPSNASDEVQKRQGTLRVMIVGDSMTHCREGDYTWRYRIWQWFQTQNVAVDFVGPYAGTAEPDEPGPPAPPPLYGSTPPDPGLRVSGTYAANFDSSHFAISGRAAAVVQGQIQGVTADYPADLMLVMLGFNDLGWFYSDDDGLIVSMTNLITNARRSNPNMKIVIGTVPHRTFIGGRQDLVTNTDSYNRMLKAQGPGWSTPTSPVVIAPVREEYDCGPQYAPDCPAAYDGLHPNELGEYQIARAFSRGLVSGLQIGNAALVVPGNIPGRPLPVPGNFQIGPSPLGLTATWDKVYGAYGYDTEYRINGGALYNFSPGSTTSNRWDTRWAQDGWTYELRVRAVAGNRKGGWTGWISGVSKPLTADLPTNVITRASATGLVINWSPPTGPYAGSVFLYNIIYWDLDTPCTFVLGAAFKGTSARIDGLFSGRRYLIAIEAWNSAGAGFPTIAKSVIVGAGPPGAPQVPQIRAQDPTTIHMTWNAVPGAAGYNFYSRNVNQAGSQFQPSGSAEGTCVDIYFLFPGTWNYEWVVAAYNGADEGGRSPPQLAPRPQDGVVVPTCPVTGTPLAGTPACSGGGAAPATDPIDPSDPSSPGVPVPGPNPTCTSGSCQPCSGSSCLGCTGNCAGCSGSGCNGCNGPECSACRGLGCVGCKSNDCTSCTGRDCGIDGGDSGGRLHCRGPLCTTCVGSGCTSCRGPLCTTCKGSDCSGSEQSCTGPDCSICSGPDCDSCEGPSCETCKGSNCGGRTNGCNGPDCFYCEGTDCVGCNSPFCETCFGLNCIGCLGPICTICRGLGCGGGINSCFGINCPTIVPPPPGPPPGPGGPVPTNGNPTSCAVKTTATNCAVDCTVSPTANSLTTRCTTVSCVPTIGCTITATTQTSTTTVGCASPPPAPPYSNLDSAAPKFGDGAYNGQFIFRPTFASATPTPAPPQTSKTAAPTPTATPTPAYADPVPAYDIVVRSINNGAGGTVDQLAGYEADLARTLYDCSDDPEWVVRSDNDEAENGLPPTFTGITVYGDNSCRYEESRDYEPTPSDGTVFVGYIYCNTWARMFCYKNETSIGDCGSFISMRQRLRCAWLAYHGGA